MRAPQFGTATVTPRGDDYVTVADFDCNDRDIDEREATKELAMHCYNNFDAAVEALITTAAELQRLKASQLQFSDEDLTDMAIVDQGVIQHGLDTLRTVKEA